MSNKNSLVISTYNTHFCQDQNQIINNIECIIEKEHASLICLQEVTRYAKGDFLIEKLLSHLGKNWSSFTHLGNGFSWSNMGTATIWNNQILKSTKNTRINLPINHKLSFHESLFSKLLAGDDSIFQRRSIVSTFNFQEHDFQIANIHLDHVGGSKQRQKQLSFILNTLNQNLFYSIVCGDFNTFDLRQSGKEVNSIQTLFGPNYKDISENIGWTADIFRTNFDKANPILKAIIKGCNIHIQKKLDYIWTKGFSCTSIKKLDVLGSDHLPIIAKLIR